jgi:hypothetical protein
MLHNAFLDILGQEVADISTRSSWEGMRLTASNTNGTDVYS